MARYVLLPQTNLRVIISFLCKLNSYHFKKLPDIWRGPWFWSMVVVPSGPQLSACSRWDSGVRREGREREKNKEEKRERDLLTPTPPPRCFSLSAHTSLRCPHDLNAWNRLPSCVQGFQYASRLVCKKAIVDLPIRLKPKFETSFH